MKACGLTQHVTDLACIVDALPRPPVLIGHSFGGLVVQRRALLYDRVCLTGRNQIRLPKLRHKSVGQSVV